MYTNYASHINYEMVKILLGAARNSNQHSNDKYWKFCTVLTHCKYSYQLHIS
jgi:hypothetical protein